MCPQNELKNFGSFRAAIYEAVTRVCGFASVTTNHFVYGVCGVCVEMYVCMERDV